MPRRKRSRTRAPPAAGPSPPPGRPLESLQLGDRLAVRDADHGYWLATFDGWACGEKRFARVRYLMKPICDHPDYCSGNGESLYLGQPEHLSHGEHWNNNQHNIQGFDEMRGHFDHSRMCFYTARANGDSQLCSDGGSSHDWRDINDARNRGQVIMCGRIVGECP